MFRTNKNQFLLSEISIYTIRFFRKFIKNLYPLINFHSFAIIWCGLHLFHSSIRMAQICRKGFIEIDLRTLETAMFNVCANTQLLFIIQYFVIVFANKIWWQTQQS